MNEYWTKHTGQAWFIRRIRELEEMTRKNRVVGSAGVEIIRTADGTSVALKQRLQAAGGGGQGGVWL